MVVSIVMEVTGGVSVKVVLVFLSRIHFGDKKHKSRSLGMNVCLGINVFREVRGQVGNWSGDGLGPDGVPSTLHLATLPETDWDLTVFRPLPTSPHCRCHLISRTLSQEKFRIIS